MVEGSSSMRHRTTEFLVCRTIAVETLVVVMMTILGVLGGRFNHAGWIQRRNLVSYASKVARHICGCLPRRVVSTAECCGHVIWSQASDPVLRQVLIERFNLRRMGGSVGIWGSEGGYNAKANPLPSWLKSGECQLFFVEVLAISEATKY